MTIASDFTLSDQKNTFHTLSDYRGKWVILFFYPKDSTPGCTTEACDFRDLKDTFEAHNAQIFGISILGTESKLKFANKHNLSYPLLADEDHAVCDKFNIWQPKKFMGKEFLGIVRTTLLIDPDGNIAHRWDKVRVKEHVNDVLNTLKQKSQA